MKNEVRVASILKALTQNQKLFYLYVPNKLNNDGIIQNIKTAITSSANDVVELAVILELT